MTRTKTRANANMPNNYVSVLDFGVVPDNGVVDQSDKFQAALDHIADYGTLGIGATLYIPPGRYKAGNLLIKQQGTHIMGAGQFNTQLLCPDGADFIFATWNGSRNPGNETKPVRHLKLEGFTITNTERLDQTSSDPDTRSAAIILAQGYSHVLSDIHIVRTGSGGNEYSLKFESGVFTTELRSCFLKKVWCGDIRRDIQRNPTTTLYFYSCDINHIDITDRSASINFFGCTFQAFASAGHPSKVVEITGEAHNIALYGCHFETDIDAANGVYSDGTGYNITVDGCYFYSFKGYPVVTNASRNVRVRNNLGSAQGARQMLTVSNDAELVTCDNYYDNTNNVDKNFNYIGRAICAPNPFGIKAFNPDDQDNVNLDTTGFLQVSASSSNVIQMLAGGNPNGTSNKITFGSSGTGPQASIANYSDDRIALTLIDSTNGNRDYHFERTSFYPLQDNVISLGKDNHRFTEVATRSVSTENVILQIDEGSNFRNAETGEYSGAVIDLKQTILDLKQRIEQLESR